MKDAGILLSEFFREVFKSDLFCQAIKNYTSIQKSVISHIDHFMDLGVPDWRLYQLPKLYKKLLDNKELLIFDGLSIDDITQLHELLSIFSQLCEQLAQYNIPETVDHCDFHDNNILIDPISKKITIIDWGESVITHPFLSIINCFRHVAYRYSFKETDDAYIEFQNTFFDAWNEYESAHHVSTIFTLAQKIYPVYESLGEYRLMMSCPEETFKLLNRKGRLVRGLKEFIKIHKET